MNLLLLLLSTTIALSMGKLFGTTSRHTIKTYFNPSPILISPEQNPYLSLPQRSSNTVEGSRLIYVDVPPPINAYIWELTGFYEAWTTGEHIFSIEGTEMATIQLGWKRKHAFSFDKLIVVTFEIFDGNPQRYKFKKGEVYPVKIMYIAGPDNGIKIFDSDSDTKVNLNTRIKSHSPHILGKTNLKINGFAFSLYTYLGSESRESMTKKYSTSELLSEGWISEEISQPKVLSQRVSNVLEILGYFRVPADGNYSVEIAPWSSSVLQIGTGRGQTGPRYLVDYGWKILDTRPSMKTSNSTFSDFHFQKSSLYPFRIVVLSNTSDPEWDLTVRYHNGTEIDIFNLWDGNGSDGVHGLENVEGVSEAPLPFNELKNYSGPLRGDMSPEIFDPTAFITHPNDHEVTDWILGEEDAVAFYASKNLRSANESTRGEKFKVGKPVWEVDSFYVDPENRDIVDASIRIALSNSTTIDLTEPQPIGANLTESLKPCKYVSHTLPEIQFSTNSCTDSADSRVSISYDSKSIVTVEMIANTKSFSNGIFGVKGSNPSYSNATKVGSPKPLEQRHTSFLYHTWNNSQQSFKKLSVSSSLASTREISKIFLKEESKRFDHIGSSPLPYTSVREKPNPDSTKPEAILALMRITTAEKTTVPNNTFPKILYQISLKESEYREELDSMTKAENLEDVKTEKASCEKILPILLSKEDIASLTISKIFSLRLILVLLIALVFL